MENGCIMPSIVAESELPIISYETYVFHPVLECNGVSILGLLHPDCQQSAGEAPFLWRRPQGNKQGLQIEQRGRDGR